MGNYDDIIALPHHEPKSHPRMSMYARAAQFAPFAALTGHNDAISESARTTDSEMELLDDALTNLNRKVQMLRQNMAARPIVTITYFSPDSRKSGGEYLCCTGYVKRFDDYERTLQMSDGSVIPFYRIFDLESDSIDFDV